MKKLESDCLAVYFNRLVFYPTKVYMDLDIVHRLSKKRVNITLYFHYFFSEVADESIVNMMRMGAIEKERMLEVKFMSSDIRDYEKVKKYLEYLLMKAEVVKDNIIILVLKNKNGLDSLV